MVLTYIDASNLNVAKTAAAAAFAVSSAGNAAISVNSVLVSGKTVTLTLSRARGQRRRNAQSELHPARDGRERNTGRCRQRRGQLHGPGRGQSGPGHHGPGAGQRHGPR
ncbi:hypothetical protein D5038_19800 [Verminephrobacter aporrectodeae subsp. tuberculatae]|nr:hypothetical protein [Verminephrobacter aporrectodeae subsp. tuberculatae]